MSDALNAELILSLNFDELQILKNAYRGFASAITWSNPINTKELCDKGYDSSSFTGPLFIAKDHHVQHALNCLHDKLAEAELKFWKEYAAGTLGK